MAMLKIPSSLCNYEKAHEKWLKILNEAQLTVNLDAELQKRSKAGKRIPTRALPVEVLGRCYASYINLINQMYDAYLTSVHLQRAPYILGIINIIVKRIYELRKELVNLIVTEYLYVDGALQHLKMTPFDIQIVVPYHFPLESRSETAEEALQKMWAEAIKRKLNKEKLAKRKDKEPELNFMGSQMRVRSRFLLEDEESEVELSVPSVHTIINEAYYQAMLIQKHERVRQWYMRDFRENSTNRKMYYATNAVEAPLELKNRAARLIQRVYREVMKIKRQRIKSIKRDIVLGLLPESKYGKLDLTEENNKIYEKHRQKRKKITEGYLKEFEKEKTKLLFMKWDGQIEDITDQIREWFEEWYFGYGFFPEYPYEVEGGTILLLTGQLVSLEEQIEIDEKEKERNKGKTAEQKKEEMAREKEEANRKAEEEKIRQKKEAEQLLKARFNPKDDPGYKVETSTATGEILQTLAEYRCAWSIYDDLPAERYGETIYGYMKPLITEDIMNTMHKDCRIFVDRLMRLDLKLLIKAHKRLYKSINKPFPKVKPRQRPPAPFVPKIFELTPEIRAKLEGIFDLGIITKPTTKFKDVFGDLNFINYDYNIRDPHPEFRPPSYCDVKDRLMLSCLLACGIQPGATRNKSVMLLGPARNGKSFLIDAVAGELNAVKIDISPECFSAVAESPNKLLSSVFLAARAFQPAVIYLRNIERVFPKKESLEHVELKSTVIKTQLPKLVKQILEREKIIFIATCSDPFGAKVKKMLSIFNEMILVPRPDYGTLSKFFNDNLPKITGIPLNFPYNTLAHVLKGYGFGIIIEVYHEVLCPERIVRMHVKSLSPAEFLEAAISKGEPLTDDEYKPYEVFYLNNSRIRNIREEYETINTYRAEYYKKMAKEEEAKANKLSSTISTT